MEFNYEFNAPNYVDFENMDDMNEQNADAFFDNVPHSPTFDVPKKSSSLTKLNDIHPEGAAGQAKASPTAVSSVNKPVTQNRYSLRKRHCSADNSRKEKFISLMEKTRLFQQRTPDRFHTRNLRSCSSSDTNVHKKSVAAETRWKVTEAQSPLLLTRNRSRSARKILTTTEPVEVVKPFRAKPVSQKMFSGPVGIPPRIVLPGVAPHSPKFTLKERFESKKKAEEQEQQLKIEKLEKKKPLKRRSGDQDHTTKSKTKKNDHAPHHGVPIILPTFAKKSTVMEPFSFEERNKRALEMRQLQLKARIEKENSERNFKATRVRSLKPSELPCVAKEPLTQLKPFHLQIDQRVSTRLQKWREEVEKAMQIAPFKAAEPEVLKKKPFMPSASNKSPCKVMDIDLNTEKRAQDRENFDLLMKQKEAEIEATRRQRETNRQMAESQEIARIRKAAIPRAQPIRHYKMIDIMGSDKPPTVPVTPKFSKK